MIEQEISGSAPWVIKNAVADIDSKYQDILKLEQSVNEVYQLFLDL